MFSFYFRSNQITFDMHLKLCVCIIHTLYCMVVDSDVWIEQSDTISNTPSTFVTKNHSSQSKSLTSVWKRIKKLFSNR